MKKNLLYLLLLFSLPVFSQGIKDRFFTNFSFTMGADLSFGPFNEVEYTSTSGSGYKGYSKDFSVVILSYQYRMRLNILEKDKDFSLGIWLPITASLSTGRLSYLVEDKEYDNYTMNYVNNSISGGSGTFGRVSLPLFLQCSFGGESTYNSDKEKGTTLGIGLDMSILPIYMDKKGIVGRRKFQKDQFIEYNLKFG
ncbi:MAG: hypothetical protein SGJ00_02655 [bacterium]|nr:hypothetical protein [bacterium]